MVSLWKNIVCVGSNVIELNSTGYKMIIVLVHCICTCMVEEEYIHKDSTRHKIPLKRVKGSKDVTSNQLSLHVDGSILVKICYLCWPSTEVCHLLVNTTG